VELDVLPVDQLDDLGDVGLIKLDVEGHEEQALQGMQSLLRHNQPVIIFELNSDAIRSGTSASVDLLRNSGYKYFYSIERYTSWRFPFGKIGHVAEVLLRGTPPPEARLLPVQSFQNRDYPCLVASPNPVNATE
jgi:hypothetical protein